jgi:hypothetical protein
MERGEESHVVFIYTTSRSQKRICHDQQQQQQRLGYLPAPRPSIRVVEGDGDSTAHAGPFAALHQFARPCRLPLMPLEQGRYHCWMEVPYYY